MQDRLKLLSWKIAWNILLCMHANVGRFINRPNEENYCVFCLQESETLAHFFFECHVAQIAWREALWLLFTHNISPQSIAECVRLILKQS